MSNPFEHFKTTTTTYHPENAYALSEAANLAYRDKVEIEEIAKNWGFDQVTFITRMETQLYIASNQESLVIAFRGTEPNKLEDWRTDIKFRANEGPFGTRVHRGFLGALELVWDKITQAIDSHYTNTQSIWITGHSLGGALAILCTAFLRDVDSYETTATNKIINGTYTYGCPRVGKASFVEKLQNDENCHIFQFVNNNDIVTRVPPWSVGYRHTGQYLYFNANGESLSLSPSFTYRTLEFFRGAMLDVGNLGPDVLTDHAIADYIKHAKSHRDNNPFK